MKFLLLFEEILMKVQTLLFGTVVMVVDLLQADMCIYMMVLRSNS